MIRSTLVLLVLVAGCASGKQQCTGAACKESSPDMATQMMPPTPDMTATPMPDLMPPPSPPDMTKLLKFGDPCTANGQCDSGICLTTNNGSFCTQVCSTICPAGYGCYPVTGVPTTGVTTNVCAPENNLLCTMCSDASTCGAGNGADHCLTYPTGTFCGRDCTTIGCPPTFNCVQMNGGDAGMIHQCVPANNACDCTAQSVGRTIACTITTSTGTKCPGVSTCNGAAGWGSCTPPSTTDLPDDNFVDSNCDGIDGDVEAAVFVDAVSGNDANAGTMAKPVATITQGLALAKTNKLTQVLVSKGTYAPVTLSSGIGIYGGYDAATKWQRANTNTTTIAGGVPAIDANFITSETHVELFTITATAQWWWGGSSYGVRVQNSSGPVVIRTSAITAVDAQPGYDGNDGGHGYGRDYNPQGYNYDGQSGGNSPDRNDGMQGNAGGGAGGVSACGSSGGRGGYGANGANGGDGDHGYGPTQIGAGSGGPSCNAGSWPSCACGHSGSPGTGQPGNSGGNGFDGNSAVPFGGVSGADYAAAGGGNGTDGTDGSGGSGGGAGGGSTGNTPWYQPSCDTDTGGGGGGAGAGGCHGSAATGGGGGGASIAVFALSSTVTLDKCTLTSGTGGHGGKGGNGGVGGAGGQVGSGGIGSGGTGTQADGDGQGGAAGGAGGKGGNGGSGAGGTGGPSAGVGEYNSNITAMRVTYSVGSGGALGVGGNNGVSAAPNGFNGIRSNFLSF